MVGLAVAVLTEHDPSFADAEDAGAGSEHGLAARDAHDGP